jgi:tryptophanyl-tRNA synthetase
MSRKRITAKLVATGARAEARLSTPHLETTRLIARRFNERYGGGAGRLKQLLTEAVIELLRPLRQRRAALGDEQTYLDRVLDDGNARARQIAERTLATVHDRLGMTYANRR